MKIPGIVASIVIGFGLLFIFTGERVFGEGTLRDALVWSGVLGVVAATALRAYERQRIHAKARPIETGLLAASAGVLLSLALYALSTDWGLELLGSSADPESRTGTILTVLWPAVLTVSFAAIIFMEFAYRRMPVAEAVELRRVRGAAFDGISIALSLVFVVSANYVANQRDVRTDLSYFKTTHPSDATLRMVDALGEDLKVVLFYPKSNEVLEQLKPYFDQVRRASPHLKLRVVDHALSPTLTRRHQIRDNGFVVVLKGEGESQQAEKFEVGTDLELARSRLRTLDGRFQRAFSRIARPRRELYVTVGHDERSATGIEGDPPDVRTRELADALERSNITTRPLGMAQGLANEVPENAPSVAVIGPRRPFMPEEARSLLEYVKAGGRLVVMVDPDVDHGLTPLLHGLGLELRPGVLASERQHLRRTNTDADRGLVFSNSYSSHPTVTLASRNSANLATVFVRGGSLDRHEGDDVVEGSRVQFPIRANAQVWRDLNENWERDSDEPIEPQNLMAVVTVPREGGGEGEDEGRAVIIADGDFVTDQVVRNPGNALVFGDVLQWFLGEEQIIGDTSSEEDVNIEHTEDEDKLWFYSTSFGVPLPLLGLGVWVAVRRGRRTRSRRETSVEPTKEKKP